MVVTLAGAAGVAIENARLQERVRDRAVLEDRERIARDLHDTVIQRLFATGLSLQAVTYITVKPEVAARIQQAVDELDLPGRRRRARAWSRQERWPRIEQPRGQSTSPRRDVRAGSTGGGGSLAEWRIPRPRSEA
jgi:GAF domain-containing protein